MDRPLARRVLVAALAIGVLGEILLDGHGLGLNAPLLVATILGAAWLVRRRGRAPDPLDAWLPVAPSSWPGSWPSGPIRSWPRLDLLGAAVCVGASMAAFSGLAVTRRSASIVLTGAAWVLEGMVVGAARVLGRARPPRGEGPRRAPAWLGGVGRGLLLAIPLVLIFAVLFASADPIFRRGFEDVLGLRIDLGDLPGRVLFVIALAWFVGGLLSVAATGIADLERASLGAAAQRPAIAGQRRLLGSTEALVVLLGVVLVVRHVRRAPARLPVRRSGHAGRGRHDLCRLRPARLLRARRRGRPGRWPHRGPGADRGRAAPPATSPWPSSSSGLILVVLASASLRLALYQAAYGWTELRLYVAVSIVAMAATLVALAVFLARDRTRWLGHAMAGIGLASLVALNVMAPAAFVAERNVERVLDPSLVPPDGHAGLDVVVPGRAARRRHPGPRRRAAGAAGDRSRDGRGAPPGPTPRAGERPGADRPGGLEPRARAGEGGAGDPPVTATLGGSWPSTTCPSRRRSSPCWPRPSDALPDGDGWLYEPKWDGFRALVFRDGDELFTQSRDLKPLDRYFPELAAPLKAALPERCVLDGEVVIAGDERAAVRGAPAAHPPGRLARGHARRRVAGLVRRLGPAGPRRRGPARRAPGRATRPARDASWALRPPPIHLTPATRDRATAADWFDRFEGAGLDGVVAKRLDAPYQPGKRAMLKIKHQRTADCVVAGFRWHKNGPGTHVGSLLLGLYDDEGTLHHVGVTSSFTWDKRGGPDRGAGPAARAARSTSIRGRNGPSGRSPARPTRPASACPGRRPAGTGARTCRGSRCASNASCEVAYDHLQGDRFRHGTTFKRWRPDKPPADCRYDQLETTAPFELQTIFSS